MKHLKNIITIVTIVALTSCAYTEGKQESKTVLYAGREAPIGGLWLDLRENKNFEFGYIKLREDKIYNGTYKHTGDTIILTFQDSVPPAIDSRLLINGKRLDYLDTQGALEISVNKLKE